MARSNNKRPARAHVRKNFLLTKSRALDNAPQLNLLSEEPVLSANSIAPYRIPKRPPILPSDDLRTCIVKYMSDGDEYSIDEMVSLMTNVTPNVEAVPKLMMDMFREGNLKDRKDISEGKTVYYYTLNQGTTVNLNTAPKKEATPYNMDHALFTILLDYKKHTANEMLDIVVSEHGFPRNLVDVRLSKLMFRSDIDRMGKGKSTTYSLKKGITMDKLLKEEPVPSPLPNVSSQALAELGEKFKIKQPKKKESDVPADMTFRKLTDEERAIRAGDTVDMMIWKVMYGNAYLTIVEVILVVRDHGARDTTIRNHFNELIEKGWFHQEVRGRRNVRHFCLKGNIEMPLPTVPAEEIPVDKPLIDTRPAIWVNDAAAKVGIPVFKFVKRLPEYGILESANQMVPAWVVDKIDMSTDPDERLAGVSLQQLARDFDVPFSILRSYDRKLNGNESLTVAGLRNLQECEDLKEHAGSVTVHDLCDRLGVGTHIVADYFAKTHNRMVTDDTVLPKNSADTITTMHQNGDLVIKTTVASLAVELKIPLADLRTWLLNNGHIKEDEHTVSDDLADRLRVDPEILDTLSGVLAVGDLAIDLNRTPAEVIKVLGGKGMLVTINQMLAKSAIDYVRENLPPKQAEVDLSKISVVQEEVKPLHATDIGNKGVLCEVIPDDKVSATADIGGIDVIMPPAIAAAISEAPTKKRPVLKLTIEVYGIQMTPAQANALALRLKAMGLEDPARREALKSGDMFNVKFSIEDQNLSVDDLFALYKELDENGFTDAE